MRQVRVIDLFQEWDEDGDGHVDRKEFRQAMSALGLDALPRKEVDALFDSFDKDGGGSIDYNELNTALRSGSAVKLDAKLQVGGAGEIVLKAVR